MYIIIAGAGVLGQDVARALVAHRHDVVVIDIVREVCDAVYAQIGATAIHGSATDIHVLEDAGAARADMYLALLHRDADNVATSLLARSLGVTSVIARLRDPGYEASFRVAGVTQLVRATSVLRDQILMHVEHPRVEETMSLRGGRVQVFAVALPDQAWAADRTVEEITQTRGFPRRCKFLGLMRDGTDEVLIPRADDRVHRGDTVLVLATGETIDRVIELLTRTR